MSTGRGKDAAGGTSRHDVTAVLVAAGGKGIRRESGAGTGSHGGGRRLSGSGRVGSVIDRSLVLHLLRLDRSSNHRGCAIAVVLLLPGCLGWIIFKLVN